MQIQRRSKRFHFTQNALAFYLDTLLYALIVSLLVGISFAPLLALVYAGEGSALKYLALLCPLLVIFVLLPLRFSFAQAIAARFRGEAFSFKTAFNASLYGEKLAEGGIYVLHLIKWALPLGAAGWALYYLYTEIEAFQVVKGISDFGAATAAVWDGILQFFGGAQNAAASGVAEGLYAIVGIVGFCLLLLLTGIMRNSSYRYIWADATELEKNPHFEARRSLRGRRWKQLGIAMINLVLLLPALVVLYRLIEPKQALEMLAAQYADALVSQTALPAIVIPYGKLAVVFFVCYLPLLPVRRMITAFFATARIRRQMQITEAAPTNTDNAQQVPPLYDDMPAAPAARKS
jgi:hypothetical protein